MSITAGLSSEGDSLEEAIKNIHEAIGVYIESMMTAGEVPPIDRYQETSKYPSPNASSE